MMLMAPSSDTRTGPTQSFPSAFQVSRRVPSAASSDAVAVIAQTASLCVRPGHGNTHPAGGVKTPVRKSKDPLAPGFAGAAAVTLCLR